MKSKENFLKNLTLVEQRKLAILYGQLTEAWNRNHTSELNSNLNEKYQELRTLQKNINQDGIQFKQELKTKCNQNLQKEEKNLQKEEANFENETQIWKQDILNVERSLQRNKEILTGNKFRYRVGKCEEDIRREFGIEETKVDDEQKIVSRQEGYIDIDTGEESRFADNFDREENKLEKEFGELEKDEQEQFRKFEREEQEDFNEFKGRIDPENEEHRIHKVEIDNALRNEFEGRYEQIAERISNRDVQSGDKLSERITTILELRGLLDNYDNEKSTLEKYRKGISIIKNGTWKE